MKKVLIIFAICASCLLGVVGITLGVFALVGGFDEKVVKIERVYFENQNFSSDGYVVELHAVSTDYGLRDKYVVIQDDYSARISFLPENSNRKTIAVKVTDESGCLEVPSTVTAGEKFTIKVKKDEDGNNITGSAILQFSSDDLVRCTLYIIVDTNFSENDLFFDTVNLPFISGTSGREYIVAKNEGTKTLHLDNVKTNAFVVDTSNIFASDIFTDRIVNISASENVITHAYNINTGKFNIQVDLKSVQSDVLVLDAYMHRNYAVQRDFELNNFSQFFTTFAAMSNAERTASAEYKAMVLKLNEYVNEYYPLFFSKSTNENAINFFTNRMQETSAGIKIVISDDGASFEAQVKAALNYMLIKSTLRLYISDVDVSSLNVGAVGVESKTMAVHSTDNFNTNFINNDFDINSLVKRFNLEIEGSTGGGGTSSIDEVAIKSLLSQVKVYAFLYDIENEIIVENKKTETVLGANSNTATNFTNGNWFKNGTTDGDREASDIYNALQLDERFVTIAYNEDTGVWSFTANIPSKEEDFQIYLAFVLTVANTSGNISTFYDFERLDIVYETLSGVVELSSFHNLMATNKNQQITEFSGALGTQRLSLNAGAIYNYNNLQYKKAMLFVEATSNTLTIDEDIYSKLKVDKSKVYSFQTMKDGTAIKYEDGDLKGYLLDFDAIEALNASYESVKLFVVFVLTDIGGNPIDRDGNKVDFTKNATDLEDKENFINLVLMYSSLVIGADDITVTNITTEIEVVTILEKLYYYTQVNGDVFVYEQNTATGKVVKYLLEGDFFERNTRQSEVSADFTRLKMLAGESYEVIVSSIPIHSIDGDGNFIWATEILNGVNSIGNLKIAMDYAVMLGLDFAVVGDGNTSVFITLSHDAPQIEELSEEESTNGAFKISIDAHNSNSNLNLLVDTDFTNSPYHYNYEISDTIAISINEVTISDITQVNDIEDFVGDKIIENFLKGAFMGDSNDENFRIGGINWEYVGGGEFSFYVGEEGDMSVFIALDKSNTNLAVFKYGMFDDIFNKLSEVGSAIKADGADVDIAEWAEYSDGDKMSAIIENLQPLLQSGDEDKKFTVTDYVELINRKVDDFNLQSLKDKLAEVEIVVEYGEDDTVAQKITKIINAIRNKKGVDVTENETISSLIIAVNAYVFVYNADNNASVQPIAEVAKLTVAIEQENVDNILDISTNNEEFIDNYIDALEEDSNEKNILKISYFVKGYKINIDEILDKYKLAKVMDLNLPDLTVGDLHTFTEKLNDVRTALFGEEAINNVFEIVSRLNELIDEYNSDYDIKIERIVISQVSNLVDYFEAGTFISATGELIIDEDGDGRIPFKSVSSESVLFDITMKFGFYPSVVEGGFEYKHVVNKNFHFFMEFDKYVPSDLTVQENIEVMGGTSIDLMGLYGEGNIINLNEERNQDLLKHIKVSIAAQPQNQPQLYFMNASDDKVKEISGLDEGKLMLYAEDAFVDQNVRITISFPYQYYDEATQQLVILSKDIIVKILKNYEVEVEDAMYQLEDGKTYDLSNSEVLKDYITVTKLSGEESGTVTPSLVVDVITNDYRDFIKFSGAKGATIEIDDIYSAVNVVVQLRIILNAGEENEIVFNYPNNITITVVPRLNISLNAGVNGMLQAMGNSGYALVNDKYKDHQYFVGENLFDLNIVTSSTDIFEEGGAVDKITLAFDFDDVYWSGNEESINILRQFYNADGSHTALLTYLIEHYSLTGNNFFYDISDGNLDFPVFDFTVIVPVKLSVAGYMKNAKTEFVDGIYYSYTYIYVPLYPMSIYYDEEGGLDVDDLQSVDLLEKEDEGLSYDISKILPLSVSRGQQINIDDYIAFVIGNELAEDDDIYLYIHANLETESENSSFVPSDSTFKLVGGAEGYDRNYVLSVGEDEANDTLVVDIRLLFPMGSSGEYFKLVETTFTLIINITD